MIRYRQTARNPRRAFSLVELVIVVVIIGMLSAIAVPRMTHTSAAAQRNALLATLTNVRKTIDVYYAEHGKYPGYDPGSGAADGAFFVAQLIQFTDSKGQTNAKYGTPYIYGPYLRAPFPKNPFNNLDTVHVKKLPTDPSPADGTVGWVAVLATGEFGLSVADADLVAVSLDTATAKEVVRGKVGG